MQAAERAYSAAGRIAIGGDLAHALPDDGALSGSQVGDISQFARREILGKVLHRGHVLFQEVAYPCGRLARGLIYFGPSGRSSQDQRRIDHGAHHAMRHALAGIAGMHVDVIASRIPADEAGVIDSVEHLSRPAMSDVFRALESDCASRLRGPESGTSASSASPLLWSPPPTMRKSVATIARLQPHIVVRVERVPVQSVRNSSFRNRKGHRVGAIGSHFRVQGESIDDRRIGGHHRSPGSYCPAAGRDYDLAVVTLFEALRQPCRNGSCRLLPRWRRQDPGDI